MQKALPHVNFNFLQIAAEALAMDALPPDHEVKARLVNIVKTVQVFSFIIC